MAIEMNIAKTKIQCFNDCTPQQLHHEPSWVLMLLSEPPLPPTHFPAHPNTTNMNTQHSATKQCTKANPNDAEQCMQA